MSLTQLQHYLARGPERAGRIRRDLGWDKSRLNRVRAMSSDILMVGRARATTYALRRPLEGLLTPVPVFHVDQAGAATCVARLQPVEPFGHYVDSEVPELVSGLVCTRPDELGQDPNLDLPWFLQDLKPEGFLGRSWLARHPDHGFPAHLTVWSGDDVLSWASRYGHDPSGALLVGQQAVELAPRLATAPIPTDQLAAALPEQVEEALRASPGGSSIGGEQPKFLLREDRQGEVVSLIVKYTAPLAQPVGERWGDLLVAEHTCLEVLRDRGHAAAATRILDVQGRRFLLSDRFDRHGEHGRSGLCSLVPFDPDGTASDLRSWSLVTSRLRDQGELSAEDHAHAAWLEAFGHGVANTDMHLGNLSLRLDRLRIAGLAPCYDMLPMAYRPRAGGEVLERLHQPDRTPTDLPVDARAAAAEVWQRLSTDARVSPWFREQVAPHHLRWLTIR